MGRRSDKRDETTSVHPLHVPVRRWSSREAVLAALVGVSLGLLLLGMYVAVRGSDGAPTPPVVTVEVSLPPVPTVIERDDVTSRPELADLLTCMDDYLAEQGLEINDENVAQAQGVCGDKLRAELNQS